MRTFKKLGVLAVAFALSAIGAASASAAATFTASATGNLIGKATTTQVLTVSGGQVKCDTAETFGPVDSTASAEQHVTVAYRDCTLGSADAHVSPATYRLTASGQIHLLNTITIDVTAESTCTITVGPQTAEAVTFSNSSGKLKAASNLTGIAYTSTGGACGASGSGGTFTGTSELERIGGGSLTHDAPPPPGGTFTYTTTGALIGKALSIQAFTFNGGSVECYDAATTGEVTDTAFSEQHYTTYFGDCTAFGFISGHISPTTYVLTASGTVHIESPFTITVTGFLIHCTVTVPAGQDVGTVSYSENGSNLVVDWDLSGITYTSSGGVCGSSGSNGTFTGSSEIDLSGGDISHH